jgi:hypothetical protein
MVRWFRPDVLFKTLLQLLRSKIVGSQLDTRELQSLAELDMRTDQDPPADPTDMRCFEFGDDDDFVFDFFADTGDGWDSTYSVASLLSRDRLQIPVAHDAEEVIELRRGRFLVLGGDAVYPTPGDNEYRNRLARPLQMAWDWCWREQAHEDASCDRQMGHYVYPEPAPNIYVLPGNHDWYDSLSSFKTWFCNLAQPRKFGAWQTDQSRSYFAIKLPQNWYLFAYDFGINSYSIDNLQRGYFSDAIDRLDSDARIILVAAEPDWVDGGVQNPRLYDRYQSIEREIVARFIERGESPPKILLSLSGDTHNYQHYVRCRKEKIEGVFSQLCAQRGMTDQAVQDACRLELSDCQYGNR